MRGQQAHPRFTPRTHLLSASRKLRSSSRCPGCRVEAFEHLQGRTKMQSCLARSSRATEALAEAQLGSRAFERRRGAIVPGPRGFKLPLERPLVGEEAAAPGGSGYSPNALGLVGLLLEICKHPDRFGDSSRPDVGLDQVGCFLNPVRLSHPVALDETRGLLQFGNRLVDQAKAKREPAKEDVHIRQCSADAEAACQLKKFRRGIPAVLP